MSAPPDPQSTPAQASAALSTAPAVAAPGARAPDTQTALRHLPSYLRLVGIAAAGLAIDLWSKHWAFHTLGQGHKPQVIIPNVLEFQTMLNSGALFGIGGGQTLLFLVASAGALLLVFWMFSQTSPRRWALQIALGGILAGALGNMYDRIFVKLIERPWPRPGHRVYMVKTGEDEQGVVLQEYPAREDGRKVVVPADKLPSEAGFVRDFIKIPTRWLGGREVWPWVFNVADMLLVGGVGILAIHLWRDRKRPVKPRPIPVDSRGPRA